MTAQSIPSSSDLLPLDSLLNVQISTASRHWQKVSEAPASISIITSGQIDLYGYETMTDVLNSLSGFYLSNDRNYSYIGIRGFSRPSDYNNRILHMLNGHPVNENVFGSIDADNTLALPLNSLERVEIVRGPGSALYGTGAVFGVVNLVTQRGQTFASSNVQVTYGSNAKRHASVLCGYSFENGLDFFVSGVWGNNRGKNLYYKEFEIPNTSDGIARELDWEKYHGLFGRVEYKNFTVQGMYTSRKKGIPTAPYETTFNDPSAQTLDARGFIGVEYNKDISNALNLKLALYYDRYQYDGTFPYDSLDYYPSYVLTQDGSTGEWITGEMQTRWNVSSKYFIVFGGEYRYNPQSSYFNKTSDTTFFNKNAAFTLLSLYLHNEYQLLPSLSLMCALRYDYFSRPISSLSPRLGLIITPSYTTTIKILHGAGYRSPNFYELYYSDQTTGFLQSVNLHGEQMHSRCIIAASRNNNCHQQEFIKLNLQS